MKHLHNYTHAMQSYIHTHTTLKSIYYILVLVHTIIRFKFHVTHNDPKQLINSIHSILLNQKKKKQSKNVTHLVRHATRKSVSNFDFIELCTIFIIYIFLYQLFQSCFDMRNMGFGVRI